MPDTVEVIDIRIPPSGWDQDATDDPMDPEMMASLIAAIAPAPAWLYETAMTARQHQSDLHISPREYARLSRADWVLNLPYPSTMPGDRLLGARVVVQREIPDGVVRVIDMSAVREDDRG